MVTHSSILAWIISWTEEPSGLQSVGSQRVGHDWAKLIKLTCTELFCLILFLVEGWEDLDKLRMTNKAYQVGRM